MTLIEIISMYKNDPYNFYKYRNSDGEPLNRVFIFESRKDYFDKYLEFYKNLPNLTELIVFASDGTFKVDQNGIHSFIRHSHQELFTDKEGNLRGVSKEVCKAVRDKLLRRMNDIINATNFDSIMQIVTECKERGFGELSIYDTSLRIAMYLNLEPDKIYLHAGARKGFEVLEEKGYIPLGASKKKYITKDELPNDLIENLNCAQIENVGCLYKEKFQQLNKIIM